MKKTNIIKPILLLTLLFGAMSAAWAEDRFYIDAVNIERGETKTLAFKLDNSKEYYGFQADITLPEGVEIVMNDSKPDITLSSRTDASYTVVSNLLSSGAVRLGTFSTSHTPISGNSGALLYLKVSADDNFVGGNISLTDILFIDANDRDVQLPDFSIETGTNNNNRFYIPDFKIAVGETKAVSIVLENTTPFSAFQTDIYLPEGLTIEANSFVLTSRASGSHSVTAKSFSDGRTRIACLSTGNSVFTGNSGELLTFNIKADKNVAEESVIELKNQIFSTDNAKEYTIPNSVTTVTTERALVESITLNKTNISLEIGDTELLTVTVLPTYASYKEVEWSSQSQNIATVSPNGLVTAVATGSTIIKAEAMDGSGKFDECRVNVLGNAVTEITLSQSSASLMETEMLKLNATVYPSIASNKSITWKSLNPDYATVDESGTVTAIKVGQATILATSVSNPEITAQCQVTIRPLPVSEIILNQNIVSIEVGGSFEFSYKILPEAATDKNVLWRIEPQSIASVNDSGKITGFTIGTAYLTATAADGFGAKAIATVHVVNTLATGIYINTPSSTEFKVGQTIELTAVVTPENATDKSVSWSSSDTRIATVSNLGIVTALSEGDVIITATNTSGISDEIMLTVIPTLAENIKIIPDNLNLSVGECASLTAVISPTTTSNKNVIWSSSDPLIAEVDSQGNITACSPGSAIIIARCGSVEGQCMITVTMPALVEVIDDDIIYVIEPSKGTAYCKGVPLLQGKARENLTIKAQVEFLGISYDVTSIADYAFYYCDEYTGTLTLPETILSIGNWAFYENRFSEKLVLPNSLISIGDNAFQFVGIPEIQLGENLVYIGFCAFDGNDYLRELTIPSSVRKISEYAFSDNPSLKSLTIYSNDLEIGERAFYGSTNTKMDIETINCYSYNPPICLYSNNNDIFNYYGSKLSVPFSSLEKYKNAVEWSKFYDIHPLYLPAVELNQTELTLEAGEFYKLEAEILYSDNDSDEIIWSIDNNSVASVSQQGEITALSEGYAVITASIKGTEASTTCQLTVIPASVPVNSITITPQGPTNIKATQTLQLVAQVFPDNATDKKVSWSSSSNDIATVSLDGLVYGVAVGKAIITATAGEVSSFIEITVEKTLAESLTLNRSTASLRVKDTIQLTAQFFPTNTTDQRVNWATDNPDIVHVSEEGLVTALNIGNCRVTATAQDGSNALAYCDITVSETAAESIKITPEGPFTLNYGDEVLLTATVLPETTTDMTVTWESQSSAVTVDQTGLVKAVAAVENNWISATNSAGWADMVYVTVLPLKVASITLSQNSSQLQVDEELNLTANVFPENATDSSLKWSSSNPSVASVDSYGHVKAISIGSTVIEVSANDGSGVKAYCYIEVVPTPVEGVTIIAKGPTSLKTNQTLQLTVTVQPDNATNREVSWSSSDIGVAYVDGNGLITAIAVGTAEITATAGNKSDKISITVEPTLIESISFTVSVLDMEVGDEEQVNVIISPASATNKQLRWISLDPDIATVDEQGKVTARSIGGTMIQAIATDGSLVNNILSVQVYPTLVEEIIIEYTGTTTLKVGDTAQLNIRILPENATDKSYFWMVSEPSVLSINETGLVTAIGIGQSEVFAFANGNYPYSKLTFTVAPTFVEKIEIEKESDRMKEGETIQLNAKIYPESATQASVDWSSSNIAVMTVDKNGLVTGKSVGYADITAIATDGSQKKATTRLYVDPTPAERIDVSALSSTILKEGETVQLFASIYPTEATYKSIIWRSSNEEIATVSDNGLVSAGSQLGTTTIIASNPDEVSGNIDITVIETPVESITILSPTATIYSGDMVEFKVDLQPSNATEKSVVWTIENEDILSRIPVLSDKNLLSCEARMPGFTTITATANNGISATISVEVKPILVEQIVLNSMPQTMNVGEKTKIQVSILPENANNKSLIWKYDQNIISINEDMIVTALKAGSTEITAFTSDGSDVKVTSQLEVKQPVTSIELNEHNLTLFPSSEFELIASIEPIDASNKSVSWESSNTFVADVDDYGVINTHEEGETTITVSTMDGSSLSDECHIKVQKQVESGVDVINIDDIDIAIGDSWIVISNIPNGASVCLFGVDGILYKSAISNGDTISFDINRNQYYILKIGAFSIKVAPK